MLTERLKAAMESAAELPPEAQDKLAEEIQNAIDNAIWDAQLNDPQYDHIIEALIAKARRGPLLPLPTPADMGDEAEDDGPSTAPHASTSNR